MSSVLLWVAEKEREREKRRDATETKTICVFILSLDNLLVQKNKTQWRPNSYRMSFRRSIRRFKSVFPPLCDTVNLLLLSPFVCFFLLLFNFLFVHDSVGLIRRCCLSSECIVIYGSSSFNFYGMTTCKSIRYKSIFERVWDSAPFTTCTPCVINMFWNYEFQL